MVELLKLNNTTNINYYYSTLSRISSKTPYYSMPFFKSFSQGIENLHCFLYNNHDEYFILPIYINEIKGFNGINEATSPYGYSGPLFSDDISNNLKLKIWNEIECKLIENKVVSLFLRFSLDSDTFGFPGLVVPTMKNIRGEILPDESNQQSNFEYKVRKNFKKALKNNLTLRIIKDIEISEEDLNAFLEIYYSTMNRNNADNSFYFPKNSFEDFIKASCGESVFAFVYDENKRIISTELILTSYDTLFSFLGGTLLEAYNLRPNDFLKVSVINWGRENGYKFYTLGGGYGANDGIFNYKKSFFPNCIVDYKTGRWIIDKKNYDEICEVSKKVLIEKNGFENFDNIEFFPLFKYYINKLNNTEY